MFHKGNNFVIFNPGKEKLCPLPGVTSNPSTTFSIFTDSFPTSASKARRASSILRAMAL